MINGNVGEGLNRPAVHSGDDLGGGIDPACAHGDITADLLEAAAPKELNGPGDAVQADPLGDEAVVDALTDDTAGDAQAGIRAEPVEDPLVVIGPEGDVRVQVAHEIVGRVLHLVVAGLERARLRAEVPPPARGPAPQPDE